MTERAEEHAVEVFARNLRKLLLQPPVHAPRVLAIDPGFQERLQDGRPSTNSATSSGTSIVHVIGKEEGSAGSRANLADAGHAATASR